MWKQRQVSGLLLLSGPRQVHQGSEALRKSKHMKKRRTPGPQERGHSKLALLPGLGLCQGRLASTVTVHLCLLVKLLSFK